MKDWNTALGAEVNCPNFDPCPLCYGCRNYDSAVVKCDRCAENQKKNICNTNIHTEQALMLMLKSRNKARL